MTNEERTKFEVELARLEAEKLAVAKTLFAKHRTVGIDASDRAEAAKQGISIEDARLARVASDRARLEARIKLIRTLLAEA